MPSPSPSTGTTTTRCRSRTGSPPPKNPLPRYRWSRSPCPVPPPFFSLTRGHFSPHWSYKSLLVDACPDLGRADKEPGSKKEKGSFQMLHHDAHSSRPVWRAKCVLPLCPLTSSLTSMGKWLCADFAQRSKVPLSSSSPFSFGPFQFWLTLFRPRAGRKFRAAPEVQGPEARARAERRRGRRTHLLLPLPLPRGEGTL